MRRDRNIRYYFTELNNVRTYYVNSQGDMVRGRARSSGTSVQPSQLHRKP